jgi:type IV pilus assembly protein PilW
MKMTKTPIRIHTGFTLTELMISLALGMIIVLAASALVVAARSVQSTQFAAALLQDTGQFALNNIARSVKQAGFINFDRDDAPVIVTDTMSPSIFGLDNATLNAASPGIENPAKSTNFSSDVLAVRFFGSGTGEPDNSILNCGGFGVPAPTSQGKAEQDRGWSIYYVANDRNGIPNLYCKYKNKRFTAQSIAQGVEAFQVLYGIDSSDGTGNSVHQFLNAGAINALDAGIPVADLNRRSSWKKITAVKIAIMIRSEMNANTEIGDAPGSASAVYNLFGPGYSRSGSGMDQGTQILHSSIAQKQKGKIRKIIGTTIQLRNSVR